MASAVQQQIQEPNILNLENKLRQQSKIAHEVGAGSQCLRCGPRCKGFDLHYWRKVCRNCRCGKENHSIAEETYDAARVGRLFDDFGNAADKGNSEAPDSNQTQQLVLAARNTQQVALQTQENEKRNRALDRQLPEHDLDPSKCQSLSDPEKQKMEEYVNNVRQFAVGRGMVQKCPAPPPQLDKILEQKLNIIHTNNNVQALSKSPKVSPKPPPKLFGVPKPYVPSSNDTSKVHATGGPVPSFTEQVKKEASKPSAASLAHNTVDELPPPPPEFLEPYPAEQQQQRSRDPVREFFDFLDEQEGKKLPGKLSSQSKTPFLANFNSAPKPFGSPRLEPKNSGGSFNSAHSRPTSIPSSGPTPSNGNETKETVPRTLTTDFDYIPDNGNVTVPQYSVESQPQQQQPERFQQHQQPHQQEPERYQQYQQPHQQQPQRTQQPSDQLQQPQNTQQQPQQLGQREVAVEAEKVWFCYKCLLPIQANQTAIFAERAGEDKCWHPECFVCTICNETLADLIYFYAEENIYCGRHYAEQMNIPRCKACDELIFATEYTNAEGANWHTNHFCCWICDTPLVGKQYTPIEGQPHCLDCYQKKYGKDCHECGKPIRADEARVSHGDLYWHASETCFRCQQCHNSLLNRQFLLKGQSTFCSRDCATKAKVTDTK